MKDEHGQQERERNKITKITEEYYRKLYESRTDIRRKFKRKIANVSSEMMPKIYEKKQRSQRRWNYN